MKKKGIFTYKSYNYLDKDPALDAARTVVQKSGMSFREVHEAGGATPATLNRWFNGEGRTCRHDALGATIRACKAEMAILLEDGSQIVIIPKNIKPSKR